MSQNPNNFVNQFLKYFLQGFVIIGPLGLTFFVIWYVFSSVESLLPSVAMRFPGVVFVSTIFGTAILGFLASKFVFGRFIFEQIDHLLEHTFGVKHIYTPMKEIMESFVGDKKKFNTPIWVKISENPETWRIGFLTQKNIIIDDKNFVAVYLPHSYAISGWVIVIEEVNTRKVKNMDAAAAMKFAVSGGIASKID